jgi:ParB family chromosome partitioning protein
LIEARRIIERRATLGRTIDARARRANAPTCHIQSGAHLPAEVERQKARGPEGRTSPSSDCCSSSAHAPVLSDENFTNLLRAEGLDTLPKYLAERVWPDGRRA